jgi:proteasome lid subunit RPN8/RPN11
MTERDTGRDAFAAPVLLKTHDDLRLPEDVRTAYLVAREGLFLVRRNAFFTSCVPAPRGPGDLAAQSSFLEPRFPRVPRALFERVVGFFATVAERHGSEAAVYLAWDPEASRVRLVVPEQLATVHEYRDGYRSAIGVHYEAPVDMPTGWLIFGDAHSHVHHSAAPSSIDIEDGAQAAGLHIVVGRVLDVKPDVYVEAVVDGVRFKLRREQVIEGFEKPCWKVPEAWIERVQVEVSTSSYLPWSYS